VRGKIMSEIIAYCGLLCNECPAYIATVQNDYALKEKTAEKWRAYKPDIKAEDINCLGCKSDIVFGHCRGCEIRACGSEKLLENCGECTSFSCDKLEVNLQHARDARERLVKFKGKNLQE
jgi:hypothetical protein